MFNTKDYLKKRKEDQLSSIMNQYQIVNNNITDNDPSTKQAVFLSSPSDLGVCRNGGRRGACYGPQSIINNLKKMALSPNISNDKLALFTVGNNELEAKDFDKAQKLYINSIHNIVKSYPSIPLIHLGGGHDHVYPLVSAISKIHKKINIINIDAHLDTRIDQANHSGTPFRQIGNELNNITSIYQIGIHSYSNAANNYNKLQKSNMKIISMDDLKTETNNFQKSISPMLEGLNLFDEDAITILSIDADVISSTQMEGVSAVNPDGIPARYIEEVLNFYCKNYNGWKILGIYEHNPIYENLSMKGTKLISSLIYNFLVKNKKA
jgi:formiminoglutamase